MMNAFKKTLLPAGAVFAVAVTACGGSAQTPPATAEKSSTSSSKLANSNSGSTGQAVQASPGSQGAPVRMSIRLRNSCSKKVNIRLERRGSSTETSIEHSTSEEFPIDNDEAVSIVSEDKRTVIQTIKVAPSMREIEIGGDCTNLSSH